MDAIPSGQGHHKTGNGGFIGRLGIVYLGIRHARSGVERKLIKSSHLGRSGVHQTHFHRAGEVFHVPKVGNRRNAAIEYRRTRIDQLGKHNPGERIHILNDQIARQGDGSRGSTERLSRNDHRNTVACYLDGQLTITPIQFKRADVAGDHGDKWSLSQGLR